MALCCANCPLRCREFSSILGLCPLDANGTSSPSCDHKNGQRRPLDTDLKGLRGQRARGDLAGEAPQRPAGPRAPGDALDSGQGCVQTQRGSAQEDLPFYYREAVPLEGVGRGRGGLTQHPPPPGCLWSLRFVPEKRAPLFLDSGLQSAQALHPRVRGEGEPRSLWAPGRNHGRRAAAPGRPRNEMLLPVATGALPHRWRDCPRPVGPAIAIPAVGLPGSPARGVPGGRRTHAALHSQQQNRGRPRVCREKKPGSFLRRHTDDTQRRKQLHFWAGGLGSPKPRWEWEFRVTGHTQMTPFHGGPNRAKPALATWAQAIESKGKPGRR